MTKSASIVLVATLLLAACGGGGGGTSANGAGFTPSGSTSPQSIDGLPAGPASIEMTNAIGSSVQSVSQFEGEVAPATVALAHRTLGVTRVAVTSACNSTVDGTGIETSVPDLNGDANSTETQVFYDSECTQLWRDTVRLFNSTARDAEVVTSTEKTYAQGLPNNPLSVKSDVTDYSQTSFSTNTGYPSLTNGYLRSSTGYLYVGSTKTIIQDYELVMQPQTGGTQNSFCSDNAGYSLVQVDTSNGPNYVSYGWNGIANGGTRTINPDGSVTWNSTHDGAFFAGALGSMSITTGESNTACPISTPEFAVTGGTQIGTHNIPVTVTFQQGILTSLSINNATVGGGAVLNANTTNNPPSNPDFIKGSVATQGDPGITIATFNVDAAGDGTLTVASGVGAASYVIVHWHVLQNTAATASLTGRSQ